MNKWIVTADSDGSASRSVWFTNRFQRYMAWWRNVSSLYVCARTARVVLWFVRVEDLAFIRHMRWPTVYRRRESR